ncbi:hypothetical protein M128_2443 [Bacteroides fragilis str. S6L8]|uniref:Uncharacterized protein n=3 Tax=Bacteroides fragilis TaxID=817 RepID=A0A015XD04_BACFG|nr:hypothetical protein M101_2208 [Bacteroides fragilis str. 1007-1-F \
MNIPKQVMPAIVSTTAILLRTDERSANIAPVNQRQIEATANK